MLSWVDLPAPSTPSKVINRGFPLPFFFCSVRSSISFPFPLDSLISSSQGIILHYAPTVILIGLNLTPFSLIWVMRNSADVVFRFWGQPPFSNYILDLGG